MKKKVLIEGMSCSHCVNHVREALGEIGATEVEVNLEGKYATLEAGDNVTDDKIREIIDEYGYEVVAIEEA